PKDAKAHYSLGTALQVKGQVEEAIAGYKKAIELDPKFADARFALACGLARAAAGQGEPGARRDRKDQGRLRQQALDSLREGLALSPRQRQAGTPAERAKVRKALHQWQKDTDLASLRDQAALARLPAQEREAFTRLWADVAALVKKAEAPPPRAAGAA